MTLGRELTPAQTEALRQLRLVYVALSTLAQDVPVSNRTGRDIAAREIANAQAAIEKVAKTIKGTNLV